MRTLGRRVLAAALVALMLASGLPAAALAADPADQTISFTSTAPTAATPGDTYTPTATATSGLPVTFTIDGAPSTVCSISAGVVSFTGVGTCTIDADQVGDSSWNAAPQVQQAVTVGKADQTISFTSTAPTAATPGDTYTPTATATSGLPVTFTIDGAPSTVCSISAGVVSFTGVGTCTIDADQVGDSSWNAAPQVQQAVTVGKADQTISFGGLGDKTYGDPAFGVSASGGGSGSPVTFSSPTTSVCSVSGSAVTIVGVGTCTIHADQAGNGNWNAATSVDQSFAVAHATPSIQLSTSVSTIETNVPVTFSVSLPAVGVGAVPAGTVTFRVTGFADVSRTLVAGAASDTVTFTAVGAKAVQVLYLSDGNYAATSDSIAPTVVANTVASSGVGLSSGSVFPVRDGWQDSVAIRGNRLESISVAITIYGPTGARVASAGFARTSGAYAYYWRGVTSSGRIMAAGRYRVVQVLTDAYGARAAYTSYVTLSTRRMYWYSKTLTVNPRNWQFGSSGNPGEISRPSASTTAALAMVNRGAAAAWRAVGYQFTLPAASTYRSLSFQVRGAWSGTTSPKFGLIPWARSWSVYSTSRRRTSMGTSRTGFYAQTITSVSGIVAGRSVRAAIDSFAPPSGWAAGPFAYSITGVRLVVSYGILR